MFVNTIPKNTKHLSRLNIRKYSYLNAVREYDTFIKMLKIVILLFLVGQLMACIPRTFDHGMVCVCDATRCDLIPGIDQLSNDGIKVMYTSSSNPGMNVKDSNFTDQADDSVVQITITDDQFQKIIGFGGAFTDSASSNILKLSSELQEKLLGSYFDDDGIEYNICRVPIGCCDFSPRLYTMDDDHDGDVTLEYFALQEEDLLIKIPVIKQALNFRSGKPLKLFGSTWTAPLWMKDRKVWHGGSVLLPEYYQTWADYHVKFFDEYLKEGIKFWGMTVGNEPNTGFMNTNIPTMGWTTTTQAKYIKENLGPTIRNSTHSNLKIMILDEIINILPFMVPPLLEDDEVLKYVDGVAMHWYQDNAYDPTLRLLAHSEKKDIFALETETCHFKTKPVLGHWPSAAEYIENIMTDLQYNYGGWVEWNLALDTAGGPTQTNTPADAPIIISDDLSEFYKQPTFYAIGHFSKYVLPDSVRIGAITDGKIRVLAFLRPDNIKVITIYNADTTGLSLQINDGSKISSPIDVPAQSINTILYNN